MTLTIILLVITAILVFAMRCLDALKSGCFYSASRGDLNNVYLKKYIRNIHFIQTPLWYCQFVPFFILLYVVFKGLNPDMFWYNLLCAYLIAQGTSTLAGPIYQGFINIGCNLPFINPNENKKMEIAIPFIKKTWWVSRFWYGKRRVYLAALGLIMINAGLVIQYIIHK